VRQYMARAAAARPAAAAAAAAAGPAARPAWHGAALGSDGAPGGPLGRFNALAWAPWRFTTNCSAQHHSLAVAARAVPTAAAAAGAGNERAPRAGAETLMLPFTPLPVALALQRMSTVAWSRMSNSRCHDGVLH
jgi:hypothetical protein